MIVHKQKGFSVIELMVAMVIGLVLLAGALSIFSSSRNTFSTNEHMSRLQENGRVALDLVTHDVRSAGYNGCSRGVPFTNTLNTPTGLLWAYVAPVQGVEWTATNTWAPTLGVTLSPVSVNQSDVLVVRAVQRDARESRLAADLATLTSDLSVVNEATFTSNRVYLISDCNAASVFQGTWTAGSPNGTMSHAAGGSNPGNASGDIGFLYTAGARIVPLESTIYWVGQDSTNSNEPSLYRRVGNGTPQVLIEGVQAMQVSYGEDTDGDRIVNFYRAANSVANWNAVISVNVSLLMRSEQWGTNKDAKAYDLMTGTGGVTIAAANDRRHRMVFTTSIALRNRAW